MSRRFALATCTALPHGDPDDAGLQAALAAHGVSAEWIAWDDPATDWAAFDLVVVRSPWDYPGRREEFIAWAAGVPRIANPAAVLAWNTDKLYLDEMAAAGLPTVPTVFVAPGEAPAADVVPGFGGGDGGPAEVVVKPTVSAGARGAGRFTTAAGARAHIATLHAEGATAMVQPYLPSVDGAGETGLLSFGGEFSHAFRKAAILREPGVATIIDPVGGLPAAAAMFAKETITPREPDPEQHAVAAEILAFLAERFGGELAYARIDLVPGPDGSPLLMEAELTEPSLYFGLAEGSVERFAAVLAAG